VEAVDPHNNSLEPFFDVVPLFVVEVTAQFVTSEGSQIPTSIDEKLCIGDIVFLGEAMQERRRGVCPATAEHVNFEQEFRLCVDGSVEPLLFGRLP
jgi:hypothetical protein